MWKKVAYIPPLWVNSAVYIVYVVYSGVPFLKQIPLSLTAFHIYEEIYYSDACLSDVVSVRVHLDIGFDSGVLLC